MARVALALTLLAAGCGLTTRDYTVQATLVAGGGAPGGNPTFNSAELTSPLAADVSEISNVSLKSAALAATDGGDLSFISHVEIDANGNGLSQVVLGTLPSAPAAGVNTVSLQVDGTNLKQYLQAGGLITANVQYGTFPVTARTVLVTLTFEGSLF
jgi:hypothetical protein